MFNNAIEFVLILAFGINIIVQMTKAYIPMPTKLWCITVSLIVNTGIMASAMTLNLIKCNAVSVSLVILGAFVSAYIAMYGFDTLKSIWKRFKGGDNINDNNRKDV